LFGSWYVDRCVFPAQGRFPEVNAVPLRTFSCLYRRIQRNAKGRYIGQYDPDNISCGEVAVPENIIAVDRIQQATYNNSYYKRPLNIFISHTNVFNVRVI
jgi:hypothetical protein